MRGSIGRIASSSSSNCTKQAFISSSSSSSSYFSTFSGGGRGRGRGIIGSSDLPKTEFNSQAPGKPVQEDTLGQGREDAPPGDGGVVGHGRGKPPLTSNPILSSFSSMISGMNQSTGRGRITQPPPPPISREPESQSGQPKNKPLNFVRGDATQPKNKPFTFVQGDATQPKNKPFTFVQGDATQPMEKPQFRRLDQNQEEGEISLKLPGMGRGKGVKDSASDEKRPAEENRHARRHPPKREEASSDVTSESSPRQPKPSREDAAKKAMGILSKDDGIREDGNRTRGKGGRRGGRDGESGMTLVESEVDDGGFRLKLGSDADGERLAQRLGPEKMAKLTAAFEEIADRLVPDPRDEAYLDALHTNNMIEFEGEYLVEFDNPDIDEKPPISLRDALEKMKPFLMVYEGIKSQEEWEEIIDELMTRVPAMKELIDYYCGPDTVTAKQQQQELERVAKTLPENVPSSVKRFTDRAVLSLQSNPGWGWDKKCQFMDKLVWEVSQQYK